MFKELKLYFENKVEALGLEQEKNPFSEKQIASTKLNNTFLVYVQTISGIRRQPQNYDLNSIVIITVFQKGFRGIDEGMNKLLERTEEIFLALINDQVDPTSGIISVRLSRIDYDPLSDSRNDNVLTAKVTLDVLHLSCLNGT